MNVTDTDTQTDAPVADLQSATDLAPAISAWTTLMNDLAAALADVFSPIVDAVAQIVHSLNGALKMTSRRQRRQWRKQLQLEHHRRLVAARHTIDTSAVIDSRRRHWGPGASR